MQQCLNFALRKANRNLNKIYDRRLQHCGIKSGQFSILKTIDYFRETTNTELQEAMLIDQTTLSRNLKPLIRDGYISVSRGDDLRVKILSLSPDGTRLFTRASKYWRLAQQEVKNKLGKEDAEKLLAISSLVSNIDS